MKQFEVVVVTKLLCRSRIVDKRNFLDQLNQL